MRLINCWMITLILVCVAAIGCATNGADPEQAKKDLEAVTSYLKENYPGKTWDAGPSAVSSEEVRSAYGKRRFCYVFSAPPPQYLGGAAPRPEDQELYRKALAKFEQEKLSLTVGIDPDGKITEYQHSGHFKQGLMKVRNDDDMKTAAAAALTLFVSDEFGQRNVTAKEVLVQKNGDAGWYCEAAHVKAWGMVFFDATRTFQSVRREVAGPRPP